MSFAKYCLFSMLIASILPLSVLAADPAPAGYLTTTRGEVFVDGKPAANGAPVNPGSRVKTGNGKTAILLAGESVIQLDRESEVVIDQVQKPVGKPMLVDVRVSHGKMRALVRDRGAPKRFNFRTPTAVMGVRGTAVFLDIPVESGPATFATLEGHADVAFDGHAVPVELPEGQSVTSADALAAPTALSADAAAALTSSVAPPRAETYTASEVDESAVDGGESELPDMADAPLIVGPDFDPIVDGQGAATIDLSPESVRL